MPGQLSAFPLGCNGPYVFYPSTALRIVLQVTGLRSCDGAKVKKEGRLMIHERRKPMMKIIAAAAFLAAAPWQRPTGPRSGAFG